MIPPKKFGEVLAELMQAKHLPISVLGERVGGRATLRRAMQDELPEAKREWMLERLQETGVFDLCELEQLKSGLMVSSMGVVEYLTKAAFFKIMSDDRAADEDKIVNEDFRRRIEAAADSDEMRVLCFNCCYPSLYSLLAPCFEKRGIDIQMRHYIRLDRPGCDAGSLIYCTAPVLSDARYQPFCIPHEAETQCFEGDFGVVQYRKGSRQSEFFFMMKNNVEVFLLPITSPLKITEFADEILGSVSPKPAALKELDTPETRQVDMMMRYLALELNRATYDVTADFANLQVPPEIASAALDRKQCAKIGMSDEEANKIRQLLAQRYYNFYNKKKPHYQIVSYKGIENFLITGNKRGNFQGFRTFTPSERVAIISDILEMSRKDPFYHLHLFKKMDYTVRFTTIGFEKLGVSVFPGRSNECSDSNYLFLTIPEFTKHLIEFILNTMTVEYCFDEMESYRVLNELLEKYKKDAGLK